MEKGQQVNQWREWDAFHSAFDPCPPRPKYYIIPPDQMTTFQSPELKQYEPHEALKKGTLWPDLYSPYPRGAKEGGR
ncbi:spore coat associated protein CotJA [Alicyclobacillus fastidiosus]|uniref:Spore coat associated protein CotJA n=1 Tax=Alicyclobacillus fastidiosus TaxID=392011 RepID=A0ABV5AJ16_9BACL|nr:spore coat associated protein CotJA [Alicyclobacillus fastidiosus]WEH11154.1 spore coat associated protein CotJA [Alicyclobacillus fastidiosus]